MTQDSKGTWSRSALTLMAGRLGGVVTAFLIPLVLVRVLDQDAFGTYKYVFMVAGTLSVLQLGLAESLYYFVPMYPAAAGRFLANATAMLAGIGLLAVAIFTATSTVALWIGGSALAPYAGGIGWYVGLTLVALPLEIVMISRGQFKAAAITYAASDSCRAALLVMPAFLAANVHAVLWGAVAFSLVRAGIFLVYAARTFGREFRWDRPRFLEQLAYALPFSVAVIIETAQVNLHQYVVWARFDPQTFAIYAAGCLQIPLVDLLTTSVGNVMMVGMTAARHEAFAVLDLWHSAVVRLASVLWPFTVALLLASHDLIVVLFTSAYLGAVPVFAIATLTIVLAVLPVDSVLRVFARTRFLIVMNLLRLAVIAGIIGWAVGHFYLAGAIAATVAGLFVAKVFALGRIAGLLHVPWRMVLPWAALGRIAVLAGACAVPVYWLGQMLHGVEPLIRGALMGGSYASVYLAADRVVSISGSRVPASVSSIKESQAVR